MRETIKERRAEAAIADLEQMLQKAIAAMKGEESHPCKAGRRDRKGGRASPWGKTWYGMPAYTNRDGKVVVFFKPGLKFKSRYATLGFEDAANLDEG